METGFPKKLSVDAWTEYLGRPLEFHETMIFHNIKVERMMNERLEELSCSVITKKLYIPALTKLYGNCLFESFVYYEMGFEPDEIRKAVAHLMYIFQDYPDFFPGQSETPKQLFECFNEIEFVMNTKNHEMYRYTYDVMCQDIAGEFNWTRLPTQLILMFISRIFNIKIMIFNNSGSEHTIDCTPATATEPAKEIFLGHIGETHYVPLAKFTEEMLPTLKVPKYNDSKLKFYKWAIEMQQQKTEKTEKIEKIEKKPTEEFTEL